MAPSMLEAALEYARAGMLVFPLTRDKVPFAKTHGHLDATCDLAQINEWFTKRPYANIGIRTGKDSGCLVIEADPRHGGDISLAVMEEQYSPLPETREVLSGGGGRHLYFRYRNGFSCSEGKLAPGIDVKTEGGYVVAPPSLHPSGNRYKWIDETQPIAEMPDWLYSLLTTLKKQPISVEPGARVPKGQQHAYLLSRAGEYRHKGDNQQTIEDKLRIDYLQRCEPPHGPPWKRGDLIAMMAERVCKLYAPGQSVPLIDESEIESTKALEFADLSEDALDGRLGEICQKHLKDFPRSAAWVALVTAAGSLVPQSPQPHVRTNLYAAPVADKGKGKSQVNERALNLVGVKDPILVKVFAGSAEGLVKKIGEAKDCGMSRLAWVDELSHLLAKAAIDRASFPYFLNHAYYHDEVSLIVAGQKELKFRARFSLLGGIVTENFQQSFGHTTTCGLYDRFIFALWPTGFEYDFLPWDGEVVDVNPRGVTIAREIWDVKKQWRKEDAELGSRIFENAIRAAAICAAWSGKSELSANDLGPARAFAEYQCKVRKVLQPNPGENLDARCAFAILSCLENQNGYVKRRDVYNTINANRFGPGAFDRAVTSLEFNGELEQVGKRPKLLRRIRGDEEGG